VAQNFLSFSQRPVFFCSSPFPGKLDLPFSDDESSVYIVLYRSDFSSLSQLSFPLLFFFVLIHSLTRFSLALRLIPPLIDLSEPLIVKGSPLFQR